MTEQEYSYVSEVQGHIFKVRRVLQYCIESLLRRFEHHDDYKLKKEGIETNHLLPQCISERYNPETRSQEFAGMNLLDLLELVADIMSETTNIEQAYSKVTEIVNEYKLSKDLEKVMRWTIRDLDRFYYRDITMKDRLKHAKKIEELLEENQNRAGITTF